MATTPPPPSTLRVPSTPRHGAGYDQYSPYATRHSTRLRSQRSTRHLNTTPPPRDSNDASSNTATRRTSEEADTLSPPGSNCGSPQPKASYRVKGSIGKEPESKSSTSADTSNFLRNRRVPQNMSGIMMTGGMLPTPETPRKKNAPDVAIAARTLFPSSHVSARSNKKPKKYTGFSLESFDDNASETQQAIEIYTDSRDRIPEVSKSEQNPFYSKSSENENAGPNTRASRRRAKAAEKKRDPEVEEAIKRDDGLVYVFRGKKTFRKFHEDLESDDCDDDDDDLGLLSARPDLVDADLPKIRPMTRSSIKPRVLFPHARDMEPDLSMHDPDEEAATDIEEQQPPVKETSEELHPSDVLDTTNRSDRLATPALDMKIDTPSSPGATTRSLRPRPRRGGLNPDGSPTASEAQKKRESPFDRWMRKKVSPEAAVSKSKKRDADIGNGPGGPATKKTRGSRATATST